MKPQEIAESLEYQFYHTISMPDKDRDALEQAVKYMRKIAEKESINNCSDNTVDQLFKILKCLALNTKLLDKNSEAALKKAISDEKKIANGELRPTVHAHWIDTGYKNSTGNIYRCSHCKGIYNPEEKAVEQTRQSEKPQYCPACGALMDGKDDSHAKK